ncbi:diacylglycerol/lipid kinase family protein [uncultured Flavonifractor sp.]|uniref:diacylglycerol/lipid kinase family protein n=1 Tax=uncultured Flavonifractor sp. TaxID=1193534 RepID=UPI00260F1D7A|nr:YegS/Rv2252/BmrU family lipid kinase [uncultured Flavonifractor sp.]
MDKLLFLYNLHAGKGMLRGKLAPILDELTRDWDVTVHPTRGPGDAAETARTRAGEFQRMVCSGGDGTLHEVVNGLMALPPEARPVVGYIPAGTTNDFAKNLRLPGTLGEAAAVAAAGLPRPVDIGSFNDKSFLYIAAFGAFTDVAYNTPQQAKSMLGHLAYVLEGATRLGSIQAYPMEVEHDGGVVKDSFCYGMVSNTISVGGFKGTPAQPVALDDGLFEVALVRQPQNPLQLQGVLKALSNMAPDEGGLVTCFRTSRLKLTAREAIDWTLDGEFGGRCREAEIVNHRQAVTIVYGE